MAKRKPPTVADVLADTGDLEAAHASLEAQLAALDVRMDQFKKQLEERRTMDRITLGLLSLAKRKPKAKTKGKSKRKP